MNRKEFYLIAIIIFLTVIVWIGFDIHRARTTSKLSNFKVLEIVPLTPTFDNDIINQLKERN